MCINWIIFPSIFPSQLLNFFLFCCHSDRLFNMAVWFLVQYPIFCIKEPCWVLEGSASNVVQLQFCIHCCHRERASAFMKRISSSCDFWCLLMLRALTSLFFYPPIPNVFFASHAPVHGLYLCFVLCIPDFKCWWKWSLWILKKLLLFYGFSEKGKV